MATVEQILLYLYIHIYKDMIYIHSVNTHTYIHTYIYISVFVPHCSGFVNEKWEKNPEQPKKVFLRPCARKHDSNYSAKTWVVDTTPPASLSVAPHLLN